MTFLFPFQHNEWRMHATYLRRLRRQSPNSVFRFEEINVQHSINVTFDDKTLIFRDIRNGEETRRYVFDIVHIYL